jgi:hypothetical protein
MTALVRVPAAVIEQGLVPIAFTANVKEQPDLTTTYDSIFMGPE